MICLGAREGGQTSQTNVTQVHYAKGEQIYSQGDPAEFWFEVTSGVVRTCHFYADGRRHLTGFFYSNDVFGVDQRAYRDCAEAVTAVSVRRHARGVIAVGTGRKPEEAALLRALHSAQECIFLLGHRTAAERVAAFLLAMTDRVAARSRVVVPMSRSDIADHLGLTIHTVSRTISDFARKRLLAIDTPHEIRILDEHGLRAMANGAQGDFDRLDALASDHGERDFQVA